MRLADYVVERLEAAGIGHAFCVAGGGAAFLDDALRNAKRMRFVCTHHEQAASMAAEAYARAGNGHGLCVVTSGPGSTNAITGCVGAWTDHAPVVFISGQVFSGQTIGTRSPGLRTLGVQEINIVDIVRPITKYSIMITDASTIRFHLEAALRVARQERPGPVWLDIPADVQNAQIDPEALVSGEQEPDNYNLRPRRELQRKVAEVLDLLRKAKRPILHVGQGIRLAGAEKALNDFMTVAGIPVVTARNGADLIASDHPHYVGRPGTFAQRGANFAVQSCDVYLAVGTRLSLAQTGYNARDYARNAKVIQVDVDGPELEKNTVPIAVKVKADAAVFLRELNSAIMFDTTAPFRSPSWENWLARCKELQAKYPPVTADQRARTEGLPCNSYGLIELLSDLAEPEDTVVTDVGFAYQNTHQAWKIKLGQRLLSNNGTAAMGWGLPAAIGACAARGGKRVICLAGDGGLMMNIQELATVAHHALPIKLFILNNGGYLTMRQSQGHAFEGVMGSDAASGISFPDFGKIAEAHGIHFIKVPHRGVMTGFVEYAMACDGPMICEVMMDPEQPQIPKSINRRLADGTIKQNAIEDSWPFLDPDEIAEALRT